MTNLKSLEEIVAGCQGATKTAQANFYHTWWGWITNDVLHVTSTSGAREKDIWHFSLERNKGKHLVMVNTTGMAFCYTRFENEYWENRAEREKGSGALHEMRTVDVAYVCPACGYRCDAWMRTIGYACPKCHAKMDTVTGVFIPDPERTGVKLTHADWVEAGKILGTENLDCKTSANGETFTIR